jgi:hypothetical protein
MSKDNNLLEMQYKLAIEARDKLNDNFHKWMTYYYVANGTILLGITSLYNKTSYDKGIFVLSLIEVFICILWNLSCKGYYYWLKSWIIIVIKLEKDVIKNDLEKLGVYSVFSGEVAKKSDSFWTPNKPANISTPKLTLIFSFISIIGWIFYSAYQFIIQFPYPIYIKIMMVIGAILIILIGYYLLPKHIISRIDENKGGHKLV